MKKQHPLEHILSSNKRAVRFKTLEDLHITQSVIDEVVDWASQVDEKGKLADYIPQLACVNPHKQAIVIADAAGNMIESGNGLEERISIQSVVKPFLYIYALEQGIPYDAISYIEPTSLSFNTDAVLNPSSQKLKPGHPLNNAGAISSSGAIHNFEDFLEFMRRLTGNSELDILTDVFNSEMDTNANNRAIAYRLVATARFKSNQEGKQALINYTKACSIGITPVELTRACVVLANGGYMNHEPFIQTSSVVRAVNSMNSFGLYERTSEISLLAAGARALSCKSGVGGLIIGIDPYRGAFTTYGPRLDKTGNSVFGKYALIALNNLLASPYSMRLSAEEIIQEIQSFE